MIQLLFPHSPFDSPELVEGPIPNSQIAPVAQWIERQPPELKAAGSNPAGRTNI